ncbi:ATP-binding protein [Streptomyces longisporoflavus]|uniref:ATP-binding protein n=1 Tax=Streptomyces longisporoflavus TaxID=28044 RepID=A0ABW7QMA2_9ACTN
MTPPAPLHTAAAETPVGVNADVWADGGSELCVSFALVPRPGSAAEARQLAKAQLLGWNIGEDCRDAAALVVSELVTNAIVHTASHRIVCELCTRPGTLRIAVRDDGYGSGVPRPAQEGPDADDEHGRGLLLVEAVSNAWGVRDEGPGAGLTVWAELRA